MSRANGYQLIVHKQSRSPVAEAYRILRTNVSFSGLDRPCRSILVTSPGPEDGKSTTAANLAVVLAQAGHRVVLVDCDLRKPAQHRFFQVENQRGLTSCLLQNLDPAEVSRNGLVENLSLVTSGPIPPNPAELLGTERVRALWPALLERYDYVIVDSPPVLAVTDAVLLAVQVEGVIMVVRPATRVDIAQEARDQLLKAGARIIGVVLNQVKMPARDYHYYYYYHRRGKEEEVRL